MTSYTEEVEKVFKMIPPPVKGFVVDPFEYPGGTICLRVYEQNVAQFDQAQRVELATYLYQARDAVRALGVRCEIEGVVGHPPDVAVIRKGRDRLKKERERDGGNNGL